MDRCRPDAAGDSVQIRLRRPYLDPALDGRQNLIYQPVLLGLLGREELIALDVPAYLVLVLPGVRRNHPLHRGAHPEDLPGLNLQVTGLTVAAFDGRLVDQDPRV